MNKPKVFGIKSPWGGDENDPRGVSYDIWYFFYSNTRRLKHLVGWHDWEESLLHPPKQQSYRCYWCGARR